MHGSSFMHACMHAWFINLTCIASFSTVCGIKGTFYKFEHNLCTNINKFGSKTSYKMNKHQLIQCSNAFGYIATPCMYINDKTFEDKFFGDFNKCIYTNFNHHF